MLDSNLYFLQDVFDCTTAVNNRPYSYSRSGLGRVCVCFFRESEARAGKNSFDTAGKYGESHAPRFAVFDGKIMVKHNCCA